MIYIYYTSSQNPLSQHIFNSHISERKKNKLKKINGIPVACSCHRSVFSPGNTAVKSVRRLFTLIVFLVSFFPYAVRVVSVVLAFTLQHQTFVLMHWQLLFVSLSLKLENLHSLMYPPGWNGDNDKKKISIFQCS